MKTYTQKQKKYFGKLAEEYAIKELSKHGKVTDFRENKQPFDLIFNKKIIEVKASQMLHYWYNDKSKYRNRIGHFLVTKKQYDLLKEKHNAYYVFVLMIGKEIINARIIHAGKIKDILSIKQLNKGRKIQHINVPLFVLYESKKLDGGVQHI